MLSDNELSALVASSVYHYHVLREDRTRMALAVNSKGTAAGMGTRPIPPFATDYGLALEAALKASHGDLELYRAADGECWGAQLNGHIDYRALGITVARALCLAALRAAGVEVEDDGEEPKP